MKIIAKEKLVNKHIDWDESYTEKTAFLKRQFQEVIGEGSYFRFEGVSDDGDNYYCIVGPAKVHAPRAKFFAGVRKLPATYSAGGKYFDSLDAAASYAKTTWGVPTPMQLKPYTSVKLHGISQKADRWKDLNEKAEEKKEDEKTGEKEVSTGKADPIRSFNLAKHLHERRKAA